LTRSRPDWHDDRVLRRLSAIVLIGLFLALGSGGVEYLHNLDHAHEDARSRTPHQQHDESNCVLHAQLRAPLLSAAWVPLLVCLGLFVAFLTLLVEQPVIHRPLNRLACRGPPALLPN
jgi:hypothetical protein